MTNYHLPYANTVGMFGLIAFGCWVNLLQVIKTLRTKLVKGVSIWTYRTLFLYVLCLLYCATSNGVLVFTISNIWAVIINGWLLMLFEKYKNEAIEKVK